MNYKIFIIWHQSSINKQFIHILMVGIVRIELTTPCVSSKCSTTELDALETNNGGR